jgi:hypothetical protein
MAIHKRKWMAVRVLRESVMFYNDVNNCITGNVSAGICSLRTAIFFLQKISSRQTNGGYNPQPNQGETNRRRCVHLLELSLFVV